ncbi:MAG: Na+/H+ antiporter [Chloroflexota bacterium]
MEQFLQTETVIIEMLLVVSLVAIAVRRLRVPYTVALVLAGLAITLQQPLVFELTPELILALFVPPLVFEAAFHLSFNELRRNLAPILLFAVPGVLLTTFIVGGIVSWGTALAFPVALVFGALIAATDPIAVVSLFRSLGVPKRLSVLIEGESLLNDGTAIVIYSIVLAVAMGGEFDAVEAFVDFTRVAVGGTVVGLLLGWLIARLIAGVDDYLIETTLTTILAFGAYLLAERLHFSGVLAVVAAGLVNGNIGPRGMSPSTRIVIFNFWEYVAFLANSLIFLLIGLQVNLASLAANWQLIVWGMAGVIVARVAVVYGLSALGNRILDVPIPFRWQHVLSWGGLRGAISLALALSLPVALGPEREQLRVMTYGVVLFTLLSQATTMRPILRLLKVITRSDGQLEYEKRHARLTAARAAESHLKNLYAQGLVSAHTFELLTPTMQTEIGAYAEAVREVLRSIPELEAEEIDTTQREVLRAQRSALLGLRRDGVISDDVFEALSAEVDARLAAERLGIETDRRDETDENRMAEPG